MRGLATIIAALVLSLAAARCSRDVVLGVDPASVPTDGSAGDGATNDAGVD